MLSFFEQERNMETIANIALLVAGEALCLTVLLVGVQIGWKSIGNLAWDSYASKKWLGGFDHYLLNGIMVAFSVVLLTLSAAFAIIIPYILFGGAS